METYPYDWLFSTWQDDYRKKQRIREAPSKRKIDGATDWLTEEEKWLMISISKMAKETFRAYNNCWETTLTVLVTTTLLRRVSITRQGVSRHFSIAMPQNNIKKNIELLHKKLRTSLF